MRNLTRAMAMAAVVVLTVNARQAFAEPVLVERRETREVVAYGDLDLGRSVDARQMAARLDKAARAVCGGAARFHPDYEVARVRVTRAFETCRGDAMKTALATLAAASVTDAYLHTPAAIRHAALPTPRAPHRVE